MPVGVLKLRNNDPFSEKTKIFFSLIIIFLAVPAAVWGADLNNLKAADVVQILNNITDFFAALIASLATLMILVAAFMYITSSGDPTKIENAKKTLVWAIVGIVVAFLAYGIVNLVASFLSYKVKNLFFSFKREGR